MDILTIQPIIREAHFQYIANGTSVKENAPNEDLSWILK